MKFFNALQYCSGYSLSGFLFLLTFLLGLTGCAPTVVRYEPVIDIKWQQQQKLHNQLQSWNISGRISIQTEDDGGQADYTWQQHNLSDYNIRLVAPMGAGTMLIRARQNGVSLKTSSGEEMFNADVDQLMQSINGWPLPVSGLRYWIRGLPAPDSQYKISEWKDSGLPGVMLQDGWRIEFKKYKSVGQYYLPGKLFINRQNNDEEVDVRLIIRQWNLGDEMLNGNQAQVQ